MKKIIAMLLALVMLFGLVACGGKAQTEKPEPQVGVDAPVEPYNGELPLVQPGEDNVITIGIINYGQVTSFDDNAYTNWLEEQTGVEIEFVQFAGSVSDAATQVSLMIASGEKLPDILYGFGGIGKAQGEEYGVDGYFLDLTEYFAHYNYYHRQSFDILFGDNDMPYKTLMRRAVVPATGGIYCFPSLSEAPLDSPKSHPWINQQWLDKLGLSAPATVEELYDVLVAFRDQDPNGNGIKDEIPMIGIAGGGYADIVYWVINAFVFCHASYHIGVTDGELWLPHRTDEYREAMKFLKKLVDEGLLSTMTWTQSSAENMAIINPTDGVYTAGIICSHADTGFEQEHDSIYTYTPLPPLKDATGRGGYGPRQGFDLAYSTFITADCEKPLLAFKLLDFIMGQESYLRLRWGEYGVDWVYSEPGKPGHLGGEADITLLNPNLWAETDAQSWHQGTTIGSEWYYEQEINPDADDWATVKNRKLLENFNNYEAAGQPEEVFTVVAYTEDEYYRRLDARADCISYINQSRAEFATGVLDPNKDSDWEKYLNGLDALNYQDWLECEQSAYTRLMSE